MVISFLHTQSYQREIGKMVEETLLIHIPVQQILRIEENPTYGTGKLFLKKEKGVEKTEYSLSASKLSDIKRQFSDIKL
jgi:hypothetical protein